MQSIEGKDYLWLHIRSLPYFRSLLRAVEARFYKDIDLPSPVLDLGCGDGHFASVAFSQKIDFGLDPWAEPIREAKTWGAYTFLTRADGSKMPFRDQYFASAVSNSVLEHIPNIEVVLVELHRVLKREAPFIFCVPNHQLNSSLSIANYAERLKLPSLADKYRLFFDKVARHYHCDPPEIWQSRLNRCGFEIVDFWHYFSPSATAVMEWGHYFGLPSLVSRKLTGKWILAPTRWNLGIIYRILKPYYEQDPIRDDGTYTFYITRRKP